MKWDAGEKFTSKLDCRCLVAWSGWSSVETRIQLLARVLGAVVAPLISTPRNNQLIVRRPPLPLAKHARHAGTSSHNFFAFVAP